MSIHAAIQELLINAINSLTEDLQDAEHKIDKLRKLIRIIVEKNKICPQCGKTYRYESGQ